MQTVNRVMLKGRKRLVYGDIEHYTNTTTMNAAGKDKIVKEEIWKLVFCGKEIG